MYLLKCKVLTLYYYLFVSNYSMRDLYLSRFFLAKMCAPFLVLFLLVCRFGLFCRGARVPFGT